MPNFVESGLDPECILLIFWTLFGLGLLFSKKFGLWLDLD